jgi:hypothetical protein
MQDSRFVFSTGSTFLKGGRAMKSMWVICGVVILALMIGAPGCKKSEEKPATTMEQKIEEQAAPVMDEAKEAVGEAKQAVEEAAAPVVEEAQEAAGEAKEVVEEAAGEVKEATGEVAEQAKDKGAELMGTAQEKAAGEADKAMEAAQPETE